jgi:hypothetical protein
LFAEHGAIHERATTDPTADAARIAARGARVLRIAPDVGEGG